MTVGGIWHAARAVRAFLRAALCAFWTTTRVSADVSEPEGVDKKCGDWNAEPFLCGLAHLGGYLSVYSIEVYTVSTNCRI